MKYDQWAKTKEENPDFKCRKCGSNEIEYHASSNDDYGDIHYHCTECKHEWWYEGPDA